MLLISAPSETTLDELATALRPYHRDAPLYAGGVPLRGSSMVEALGLVDGAVLEVGASAPTSPAASGLRLRIEAGVRAGETIPLAAGEHVIGREGAAIVIADPEISRRHCRLLVSEREPGGVSVRVEDLGSSNGTGVDGVRITAPTVLSPGQTLTLGRSRCSLAVDDPPSLETIVGDDGTLQVKFQKRVDVHPLPGAVRLSWPSPPTESEPTKFPLLAIIAPLVMSLLLAWITGRLLMLAFALMSPVMGAANYFSDRKRTRERKEGAFARYQESLERVESRLRDATQRELVIHRARWPSVAETVEAARCPSGRLWQRRPEDDDATEVRVGVATRRARSVEIESQRDAKAPEIPDLRCDPVGLSLIESGNLGVQGPDEAARGLVRSLLVQLATYHPPHQLTMSAVFRDGAQADFEWVRWLPHFRSGAVTRVGNTPETAAAELTWLAELVAGRKASHDARGGTRFPIHVAVVEDTGTYDPAATEMVLTHGPAVGVHCIVVERGRERVPGQCRAAVNLAADIEGVGWSASVELADSTTVPDLDVELLSASIASIAARSMAPLRPFAVTADDAGGLPTVVRLLDRLGIRDVDSGAVLDRWTAAPSSTAAVIGQSASGPASFDLAMTPHGLAGGTTGTGKSQLLISMIGSLAIANSPDELNFVLVDFKGGGAFHRCAELPHTVAMLTNLTGDVARTIRSLDIELNRREALFRPYDASLVSYERARRSDPSIGPKVARLVVVIDEYAEFIGDHDDLEEELESLARKGRSVGMHLILGTQAPSQAIRGKIDAQLELGIALRLKDVGESLHVIKDPAAADLPIEPRGRAYMRTAGPPLELQVATLGLPVARAAERIDLRVVDRPWAEVRQPPPPPTVRPMDAGPAEADRTDLDKLVDLLVAAAHRGGIKTKASPVLAMLPSAVSVEVVDPAPGPEDPSDPKVDATSGAGPHPAPRGADPRMWLEEHLWEQRHVPGGWSPEDGNLLVVGAPGSGRTTMLRTIAGTLASSRPVDDLHIQVMDFEGALLALEEVPHVGTVAPRADRLRVQRLVTWLNAELELRRELVVTQQRAGSLWELRDRGDECPPVIVLLVDQWEQAHQSEWEEVQDLLVRVFKEGPPLGVVSVVSSDARRLNRIIEAMPNRVALRLTDRGGYPEVLGDHIKARDVPIITSNGRGFRTMQHVTGGFELVELQVAHLGPSPDGAAQNAALASISARVVTPRRAAPYRIDPMPRTIDLDSAIALGPAAPSARAVPIGVGGDQLAMQWFDLDTERVLVIAGDPGSGRTTTISTTRSFLDRQGVEVVTVLHGGSGRDVRALPGRLIAATDLAEHVGLIDRRAVVFVDDAGAIDDAKVQQALEDLAGDSAGPPLIAAATSDDLRSRTRGLNRVLGARRTGLLLNPQRRHDELFGLRISRMESITGPPGRAFLVSSASPTLVQVPISPH